ncbi:MAG: hypothetical protein IJ352_09475 [Muribaculaceae bacterium]|nr:hypothetical protein [Muribaculaceae bacterium]
MGLFDKLKETAANAANVIKNEYEEFTQQTPPRSPQQPPVAPPQYQQPPAPPSMMPPQPAVPPVQSNTSSDGLYSDKINKLIDMALVDGQLTEKEKQILFKNAQREGVDLDEFEMVLEAKMFERSQQIQQAQAQQMAQMAPPPPAAMPQATVASQVAPKSNKYGDIRKCPACGAMLQSFQTCCPECGHEIMGVQANASIQKLFEMLNDIESTRKSGSKNIFAQAFTMGPDAVDQRKLECIKSFPIPTTREDILEFLCMALPLAKKQKRRFWADEDEMKNVEKHNSFVPTWKAKCEQIIMKARFSMKEDKATLAEIEHYAQELNKK